MMAGRVVRFFAVDDGQLLEQEDAHEACDQRHHQRSCFKRCDVRDLDDLRDQIEEHHADQQPGRERHDGLQIALIAERKRSAGEGHRKRQQSPQRIHWARIVQL
jgi:hypothetical protein